MTFHLLGPMVLLPNQLLESEALFQTLSCSSLTCTCWISVPEKGTFLRVDLEFLLPTGWCFLGSIESTTRVLPSAHESVTVMEWF